MIKTAIQTGVLGSGYAKPQSGILIAKNIYNKYSDLDAKNFLWTASVESVPDKEAIYYLCRELKMASLFDKISVLYPFVGCDYSSSSSVVANSFRYNLKDPTQFLCTVNGGATYSRNGYTPNGVNGYFDTRFAPSRLNINNIHLSVYSRTAAQASLNSIDIGSGGGTLFTAVRIRNTSNQYVGIVNAGGGVTQTNTDGRGLYLAQRTASNLQLIYKNGANVGSNGIASTSNNTSTVAIGALGGSPSGSYVSREYCFASIGLGLTIRENVDFYTIVQNFQTILGRAV